MRVMNGVLSVCFLAFGVGLLCVSVMCHWASSADVWRVQDIEQCVSQTIADEIATDCEIAGEGGYLDCVAWRNREMHRSTLRTLCEQGAKPQEIQL